MKTNINKTWLLYTVFPVILIGAAVLSIYSNTLRSPFIFDDNIFIVNNPAVHIDRLNPSGIETAIFKAYPKYRFIPSLTFAINYALGGYDTSGYHVVNIAIHLICAIFLFFFIRLTLILNTNSRFSGKSRDAAQKNASIIAFFATLVWAVHPTGTEATTYICQRMTSLAALFFLLSLFLYAKGRIAQRAGIARFRVCSFFTGSVIAGFFAVASKQNAATLPFFIILYEWFFFQDLAFPHNLKKLIPVSAALFTFAAIAFIYLGENPFSRIMASYTHRDFTLVQRVMTEWRVVIYYISLIFWPAPSRLTLDHDYPLSTSLFHPATTLICLAAILLVLFIAVIHAKKNRVISFCIIWFFGNLVIESSIIGLEIIYEHRLYLPMMPAFLILSILLFKTFRTPKGKTYTAVVLTLTAMLFSAWTYQRNNVWRDRIMFWSDCVKKAPQDARPRTNLGFALLDRGHVKKAEKILSEAIKIDPLSSEAHNNLGRAFLALNQTDKAIAHFSRAIKLDPKSTTAYVNMGNAMRLAGKTDAAIEKYKEALKTDPGQYRAYIEIGKTLLTVKHEPAQAIPFLKAAILLNPYDFTAHYTLAGALKKTGDLKHAIREYERAISLSPENSQVCNDFANTLAMSGDTGRALSFYQKAVKLDHANINALINAGNLLLRTNRPKKAFSSFSAALAKDPENINALFSLGILFASEKKYDRAISLFKKIVKKDPKKNAARYNIACIYARQNMRKKAIKWLKQAVEHGYNNPNQIKTDPDLENIRQEPYYKRLTRP